MKKMAALFFSVCLLLTGCATPVEELEPEQRDTVNLSITSHLQSIDPHDVSNRQDQMVRAQLYEGLFHFDELTGDAHLLLAENYSSNEDGTVYTFDLRKDVKFHNGDDMLASDVAFSLKRAKESPHWAAYAAEIKDVVPIDDHTVEIILYEPSAALEINLARLLIVSEREVTAQGDEFGTKVALAGTGPYFLTSLKNDEKWTLEAFPEYWRGEASIKHINYQPIVDVSAGLIAFEAGELDWYLAPAADWDRLVSNPDYNTEILIANHTTFLGINYEANDKLADDNIRKAIAYCIDKEAINLASFDGLGIEADYIMHPQYNAGAPSGGIVYNYDPDKSKELLAQAGYSDGVYVGKILTFPGSHYEKCAQVVQANMEAVGIHADLEIVEQASMIRRSNVQDYDLVTTAWNFFGDYSGMRLRAHSESVGALTVDFKGDKFDYQRIDKLIEDSSRELDPERRLELTQELNDIIMDTSTLIPLLYMPTPFVWNKDLNVVNAPILYHVYDWSWK